MKNRAGLVRVLIRRKDGVEQHYWVRPDEVNAFIKKQKAKGNAILSVGGAGAMKQKANLPLDMIVMGAGADEPVQVGIPPALLDRWERIRSRIDYYSSDPFESTPSGNTIYDLSSKLESWLRDVKSTYPPIQEQDVRELVLPHVKRWLEHAVNKLVEHGLSFTREGITRYGVFPQGILLAYLYLDEDEAVEKFISYGDKLFTMLTSEKDIDHYSKVVAKIFIMQLAFAPALVELKKNENILKMAKAIRKWFSPEQRREPFTAKETADVFHIISSTVMNNPQWRDSEAGEMIIDTVMDLFPAVAKEWREQNYKLDVFDLEVYNSFSLILSNKKPFEAIYRLFDMVIKGIIPDRFPDAISSVRINPADLIQEIASAHPDYDWHREFALLDELVENGNREAFQRGVDLLIPLAAGDRTLENRLWVYLGEYAPELLRDFRKKLEQYQQERGSEG